MKPLSLLISLILLSAPQAPAQPENEPLPSLDELLGLDESPSDTDDQSTDATDAQLTRTLEKDQSVSDQFVQAVSLMKESADRLTAQHDTGIVTQRLQEDILKKLDELIDQASKQQSSSSSSSSSTTQQQTSQQPNKPKQSQSQQNQGENKGEKPPPPGQAARLGAQANLSGATWGQLPKRLRQALLQGSADRYSTLYESLTQSYYRRLAEEASQ